MLGQLDPLRVRGGRKLTKPVLNYIVHFQMNLDKELVSAVSNEIVNGNGLIARHFSFVLKILSI